jgi:succinyl-CoA---D-citramalate CoA-transferase
MAAAPALHGLRVIDAASLHGRPVATSILADLGAEVIKVEPPDGDPYRRRLSGPACPRARDLLK